MMKARIVLALATFAALSGLASRDAHALGPVDIEVGAIAGGGNKPSNISSAAPNPLGFGIGGRAGVDFFGFYGGVKVLDYLGGKDGAGVSYHSLMEGLELGYNLGVSVLTIRPQLGLGNYTLTASDGGLSNNTGSFYLEPGVVGLISLGLIYVGADVNALLLTSLPQSTGKNGLDVALTVHGQIGLKF